MRQLLPFLFFCFTGLLNAQCPNGNYTVHNSVYATGFITQYPNCTVLPGSIIVQTSASTQNILYNFNGFQNLTAINGSIIIDYDLQMTSLDGLENLTSIGGDLIIKNTNISDISALSNLTYVGGNIEIGGNQITSLAALNNLEYIGGDFKFGDGGYMSQLGLDLNLAVIPGDLMIGTALCTNYNGLNSITTVGGNLHIYGQHLTDLSGFANIETIGESLVIESMPPQLTSTSSFSSLTSIGGVLSLLDVAFLNLNGFSNLNQLGGLSLNQCYALNSISALQGLTSIGGNVNIQETKLTNLNGLQNVNSIAGQLHIYDNTLLSNISALEHINPSSITELLIYVNPLLQVCNLPNICYYLENDGDVFHLSNNAEGCDSQEQVELACNNTYKNALTGTVKLGTGDSCTNTPIYLSDIKVNATSEDMLHSYTTFTNLGGNYKIFVPQGVYNSHIEEDFPFFTPIVPNFTTTFTGVGGTTTNNFCLLAEQPIDDVKVMLFPISESRPGFNTSYRIIYQNMGTVVKSGSISFQYDAIRGTFVSSSPSAVTNNQGTITWSYNNLNPFERRYITIVLNNLPPPVTNNGEINTIVASAYPLTDDHSEDNIATLNQELIGSFDPNDKEVMEGNEVLIDNADEYLTYKIRFQNTGTASAINVRIEDDLDTKLDWSTFIPVASSTGTNSSYRVELNDGKMIVYFNNINLPAQVNNDLGSNGFFVYKIKPRSNVALGDVISNTAAIVFDFNTPVITNTVTTTFVQQLSTDGNKKFNNFKVYPNPVSDVLYFEAPDTTIVAIDVYGILGQAVIAEKNKNGLRQIDISSLSQGVYQCKFTDSEGNTEVRKVIVK